MRLFQLGRVSHNKEELLALRGLHLGLAPSLGRQLLHSIERQRTDKMAHLKAIYFVRPTHENVRLLQEEFKEPKYGEYHIFFSNVLKSADLEIHLFAEYCREHFCEDAVIFLLETALFSLLFSLLPSNERPGDLIQKLLRGASDAAAAALSTTTVSSSSSF